MDIVTAQGVDGDETHMWWLAASPQGGERWRDLAADTVAQLGGDREAVTLTRLGVYELISNVVKHVWWEPRCRLVIAKRAGRVRVSVHDHSPAAPALTIPDWDSEFGRGLWLLREMALDLGHTCFPDGKAVWFLFPLTAVDAVVAGQ